MIEAPATPPSAERGPVRNPERERRGRLLRRPTFPAVLGMLVALIVIVPLLEELARLRVGQMLGLAGLAIPILAVAAASDRPGHRRVAFALAAISALGQRCDAAGTGRSPLGGQRRLVDLPRVHDVPRAERRAAKRARHPGDRGGRARQLRADRLDVGDRVRRCRNALARLDSLRRRLRRDALLGSPLFQLCVAADDWLRRHHAGVEGRSHACRARRTARHGVHDGAARCAGRQGPGRREDE